jgi:plastocyanin domain-containing protein
VYLPNTLTVVEDIPVQWDIYGADFMGCADTLVMRQFGVNTYLKSGPNTVEFTPTKTGQFTFSCSMGMIRGTMNVIPQE